MQLDEIHEILFPALDREAADPLKVAWTTPGMPITPKVVPGRVTPQWMHRHMAMTPNLRFTLVAIATLQAAGEAATPLTVSELIGCCPQVARRKLNFLAGIMNPWYRDYWETDRPLLARKKYGRRYRYWIVEPCDDSS